MEGWVGLSTWLGVGLIVQLHRSLFTHSLMWYNDVIVCVTVIKSDERVLFHQTGSISSDKSDHSHCWLWTQPLTDRQYTTTVYHITHSGNSTNNQTDLKIGFLYWQKLWSRGHILANSTAALLFVHTRTVVSERWRQYSKHASMRLPISVQ